MSRKKYFIRTAQHVEIEYTLADVGTRIGAFLLDSLIKFGYIMVLFIIGSAFSAVLFSDSGEGFLIVFLIIGIFPIILYHPLLEYFNDGQTLGKKATNIKVISEDNRPLTGMQIFLRFVLRLVDINIASGIIAIVAIASTDKSQRIGDMAAGTLVISTRNRSRNRNLSNLIQGDIEETEEDAILNITYEQAHFITEAHAELIEKVLKVRGENKILLCNNLASKICKTYDIKTQQPVVLFLKTLLDDYYRLKRGYE